MVGVVQREKKNWNYASCGSNLTMMMLAAEKNEHKLDKESISLSGLAEGGKPFWGR